MRSLLVALLVSSLIAYFLWQQSSTVTPTVQADLASDSAASPAAASASGSPISAPAMRLDENGGRLLNAAGLPDGPPLPVAKPLPIKAAPGQIIGYSTDARGVSQPLRAGDLKAVPNSPGTYAVVDMWADDGYVVVPATAPGNRLTEKELVRAREEERKRDARAR